jgi:hypothetical protein
MNEEKYQALLCSLSTANALLADIKKKVFDDIEPLLGKHSLEMGIILTRVDAAVSEIEKIEKVVVSGNGDSLVTKVRLQEQNQSSLREDFEEHKKEGQEKSGSKHAMKVAVIGLATSILWPIAQSLLKP